MPYVVAHHLPKPEIGVDRTPNNANGGGGPALQFAEDEASHTRRLKTGDRDRAFRKLFLKKASKIPFAPRSCVDGEPADIPHVGAECGQLAIMFAVGGRYGNGAFGTQHCKQMRDGCPEFVRQATGWIRAVTVG